MNNKIISSFHISKPNFTQRPSLNQEIGDYILKHTIGEGAFSKVKLAVHKPSNNIVAIKILDKTKISKSDQIRTVREMKILTSLNHPNIIQAIYLCLQEGTFLPLAKTVHINRFLSTLFLSFHSIPQ